jgi:hypothetical protein
VWVRLTDSEDAAVTQAAEARGIRPSELARTALLAFLDPQVAQQPGVDAPAAAPVLVRLDALAGTLGRHVGELGRLVPATDAALAERTEVRGTLEDLARGIGVMAGSIAPDDGGEAAFGPDR